MTRSRYRSRVRLFGAGVWLLLSIGCAPRPLPVPPPTTFLSEPDPAQVESMFFLLGDAGDVREGESPLLARLQWDIERWAGEIEGQANVALLILGDIVYPVGVRDPSTEQFHSDTAYVMSQVRLVAGPEARRRGVQGYFIAGNHDWGQPGRGEGLDRLENLRDVLLGARATTAADVRLVPAAGTGGPYVLDWGAHIRLVLLDTQWWLVGGTDVERDEVLAGIDDAFATAGSRQIMIAAHHPFRTSGPHGGAFSIWRTLGVRYLLFRSGALLQDITSAPYRDLEFGLREIFTRHGPPIVFAGGHEHSLQVISGIERFDPPFSLVSGSGSKLSRVGTAPGTRFASSTPGYMRLVVERDGGVTLFVEATEPEFQKCGGDEEARLRCMSDGVAAFRTVYSQRLR